MPKLNEDQFLSLVKSAQNRLKVSRLSSSEAKLSELSGVKAEIIRKLASARDLTTEDELLSEFRGKDWERLLGAAGVYPEDWVREAGLDGGCFAAGQYLVPSGVKPSEAMDKKVRVLIGITSEFYYLASQKYLKKHGKPARDHLGTCVTCG